MELKFSEPKLNQDNFCPYIEIEYKTKLALDREMFMALSIAGENILNVLVSEYRDALEGQLGDELQKYNLSIYSLIATWNKVKKCLREASSQLVVKMEEHDEFEEFLLHNELELAWDALAVIGKKQKGSSLFWEKMRLAALEMRLQKNEVENEKESL